MNQESCTSEDSSIQINAEDLQLSSSDIPSIYLITLFTVIVSIFALPFIVVDISIKSTGILRPATEITTVKAPSSGNVSLIDVSPGDYVRKGQFLFSLDSLFISQKLRFLEIELNEDEAYKHDLTMLTAAVKNPKLKTPFYIQSYVDYLKTIDDLLIIHGKNKSNFERNQKLYDQRVISAAEFETHKFEFDKSQSDLVLQKESRMIQWMSELMKYEKEIAEHDAQVKQLKSELKLLTVSAPCNGVIEFLEPRQAGTYIGASQDIIRISPDTTLVAEVYVDPSDIGLVKSGMNTRIQVDAFNYNQWGMVTGKIIDISSDIHIINERPFFRIKCSLDQNHLALKTGYKGFLKKGMTLRARFTVTQRSLWQLLFDKVDNWLNPYFE